MAVTPPYAFRVNRVTISGTCFSGNEQWSTGFYLGSPNGDAADPEGHAAIIEPFWTALWNPGSATAFSNKYATTQIKVAQVKTDGKTDPDMIDYYTYPVALNGGSAAAPLPPQCATVCTLTSDIQRGLAAKGRMYMPGITFLPEGTTGKHSAGSVTALMNVMETFLNAVHQPGGNLQNLILASHGRRLRDLVSGEVTGYVGAKNAVVTGFRIGDVIDTQRRRRDDLTEVYQSRVLAQA